MRHFRWVLRTSQWESEKVSIEFVVWNISSQYIHRQHELNMSSVSNQIVFNEFSVSIQLVFSEYSMSIQWVIMSARASPQTRSREVSQIPKNLLGDSIIYSKTSSQKNIGLIYPANRYTHGVTANQMYINNKVTIKHKVIGEHQNRSSCLQSDHLLYRVKSSITSVEINFK